GGGSEEGRGGCVGGRGGAASRMAAPGTLCCPPLWIGVVLGVRGSRWSASPFTAFAVFQLTLPGADKELTNCAEEDQQNRAPHEGTGADRSDPPAFQGNKRLRPSEHGRGRPHRGRPSQESSESGTPL